MEELHNDYPLAPGKIKIKKLILSDYQLKIADLYNIPIGSVKKLMPNFFDKEKFVIQHENLQLYIRSGLKLKNTLSIRVWLKQCVLTHKNNRSRKKW